MAMNGNDMGQEVFDAIIDEAATEEAREGCLELWQKICNAIVDHITTNAEVPAGISVSTSGSPTAQSGATIEPGSVT